MKQSIVSKLEIVALYVAFMAVGFWFEPPLLYTNYAVEVGAIFLVFLLIDTHQDFVRIIKWANSR